MRWKVLVSAPYMQSVIDRFGSVFEENDIELFVPPVQERFTEEELLHQPAGPPYEAGRVAKKHLDDLGAKHPLGRVGRPEDIARAILYLADRDQSSFMTGQTLVVDGGALARLSTE
jgi:hypothetical protein